jgi:hypothetical protein
MKEFRNLDGSSATWLEVLPEDVRRRRLRQEAVWAAALFSASLTGFALFGLVGIAYLALSVVLPVALLFRVRRRMATGVVRRYSEETTVVRGKSVSRFTSAALLAQRYHEPQPWELRAWRNSMGWLMSALLVATGAVLLLGLKYIPHFGSAIAVVFWVFSSEIKSTRRP